MGVFVDASHDGFVSIVLSSQDIGTIGGLDHGAPSSTISFVATTFVVGIYVGNSIDNASIDLKKIKTFVFFAIASTYQRKAIIQVLELKSTSELDFDLESNFWNDLFEKDLKKYDDRLQAMHYCPSLETINVNKAIGHIFSHL